MTDLFAPSVLAKSVHDTLDAAMATIPPGRSHAILLDGTATEARLLYVTKPSDHWTVALEGTYDGTHVAGKVAVAASW